MKVILFSIVFIICLYSCRQLIVTDNAKKNGKASCHLKKSLTKRSKIERKHPGNYENCEGRPVQYTVKALARMPGAGYHKCEMDLRIMSLSTHCTLS
jgi:hypothetical protein